MYTKVCQACKRPFEFKTQEIAHGFEKCFACIMNEPTARNIVDFLWHPKEQEKNFPYSSKEDMVADVVNVLGNNMPSFLRTFLYNNFK